jgi:glycogen synthase
MKILVLTNLYPPIYFGGYELECRDIAEGLGARGHDIAVVTSMCGVSSPQVEGHVHRVLRFLPEEIDSSAYSSKLAGLPAYARAQWRLGQVSRDNAAVVSSLIEQVRPDVAFLWNMSDVTFSPTASVSKHRLPRVTRIATPWVVDALRYHAGPNSLRNAIRASLTGVKNPNSCLTEGLFITPSDFIGRQLTDSGIPGDRVVTIYCPAHIPPQMPGPYQGDVFKMMFAGRVCEEKGPHVAVRAVGELAKDKDAGPFQLDIVGNGPADYLDKLKKEAESLGVADRVSFMPAVPRERLESMRAEYHSFVFTSIWPEPGAMILIENMAYGLPIIASPAGGTGEYLLDGENALVFPVQDHLALAAAMKRLMVDRSLLSRLRDGGRRTACERFDFEKILDQYERHLFNALGRARGTQAVEDGVIGKS